MTPVFVDTGAFFGLFVAEDEHHERALNLFQRADDEGWDLITSNSTVFETYALLVNRSRRGREDGIAFLDLLQAGDIVIERVTVEDEQEAEGILRSFTDKPFSYCDALSFVMMTRLRSGAAMSFDGHFERYGRFQVL